MPAKPAGNTSTLASSLGRPIKVAIVENQTKVSENWTLLIDSFPDLTCVCFCESAEKALAIIPKTLPDVVLMDIMLPRRSGIECTARLKTKLPYLQIVMFTAVEDHELLFMSLEAGADGYLLKRTTPADLRNAILDVLGGGVPMSPQIARRVIESFRSSSKNNDESLRLSTREDQILQLVSQGHSNRLIAQKLDIGAETVSSHLKRAFKKLHVRSRTAAASCYINLKQTQQQMNYGKAQGRFAMLPLFGFDNGWV